MGRASYSDIRGHLSRMEPFEGNSMSADWRVEYHPEDDHLPYKERRRYDVYRVLSYSTAIAEWWPELDGGTLVTTDRTYSTTTARHLGMLWHLERATRETQRFYEYPHRVVDTTTYYDRRLRAV